MALFDIFGIGSSADYLSGFMSEEERRRLQEKAGRNALLQGSLAMLANSGYSRTPVSLGQILGAGGQAGLQAYQGTLDQGAQNVMTQQRLQEMKRKQDLQNRTQEMLGSIQDPQERLYAELAPEQYVAGKLKPRSQQAFALLTPEQANAYGLPSDRGQRYQMTENGVQLISGTEQKEKTEPSMPSSVQEYQFAKSQGFKGSFEDWKKLNKQEGVTVNYGAPMAALDAQGNPVFIQPSKTGGAPAVIPGFRPEGKPATESQAKANAFSSQMRSASGEFERLQSEGFNPTAVSSQVSTALAGTPLTALADPKAQQANQAQQQWAEAYLRFKTGAAATEGEVVRNMRTFFPQIGDSKEVIAQKARMRKQAEADVAGAGKQSPQAEQPQAQPSKPKQRTFDISGKKVNAELSADGNYYVTVKGKRYRVEE